MQYFQCSVFRNNQSSLSRKSIVFECYLYTYLSGFADQILRSWSSNRKCLSKRGCPLVFDPVSCLLFITVFEFAITFWVWLVNSFQKVRVETSLFSDYIIDDTQIMIFQMVIMILMIMMMMKIILMIIMIIITIMIIVMMIMITIMIMIMVLRQ